MPKSQASPTVKFDQKAGSWGKVSLKFQPDFVEFKAEPRAGESVSFRTPYSLLPPSVEYTKYRPADDIVPVVFIVLPVLCLIYLFIYGPTPFIPLFFGPAVLAGAALVAFRARQRNPRRFTCMTTGSGTIMVWQNRQHDEIIALLEDRRLKALKELDRFVFLADISSELGKFRYLMDQGIISAEDFKQRRKQLLEFEHEEELRGFVSPTPELTQ